MKNNSIKAIYDIKNDWRTFSLLPLKLTQKKEFLIRALIADSRVYQLLSEEKRADKELFLSALNHFYSHQKERDPVKYAPSSLLDDVEIIKIVTKKVLGNFKYASERIRKSHEIVCDLVSDNQKLFSILDESMRDDPRVVTAAVLQRTDNFYYASERLKNDDDFVLSCLQTEGINRNLIRYAAYRFRDDKSIILKAINKFGPWAYLSASPRLMSDRQLVEIALNGGVWAHNVYPEWVRSDRDLWVIAIKHNSYAFNEAHWSLKHYVNFCIDAYKANAGCLDYISGRIRRLSSFKKMIKNENV